MVDVIGADAGFDGAAGGRAVGVDPEDRLGPVVTDAALRCIALLPAVHDAARDLLAVGLDLAREFALALLGLKLHLHGLVAELLRFQNSGLVLLFDEERALFPERRVRGDAADEAKECFGGSFFLFDGSSHEVEAFSAPADQVHLLAIFFAMAKGDVACADAGGGGLGAFGGVLCGGFGLCFATLHEFTEEAALEAHGEHAHCSRAAVRVVGFGAFVVAAREDDDFAVFSCTFVAIEEGVAVAGGDGFADGDVDHVRLDVLEQAIALAGEVLAVGAGELGAGGGGQLDASHLFGVLLEVCVGLHELAEGRWDDVRCFGSEGAEDRVRIPRVHLAGGRGEEGAAVRARGAEGGREGDEVALPGLGEGAGGAEGGGHDRFREEGAGLGVGELAPDVGGLGLFGLRGLRLCGGCARRSLRCAVGRCGLRGLGRSCLYLRLEAGGGG